MQALQQWSFPTFGLMKSQGYDKLACTTQHPPILPSQAPRSLKRSTADRGNLDASPVKRLKMADAPARPLLQSDAPATQSSPMQAPIAPASAPGATQVSSPSQPSSAKVDLARAKIEAEINLAILMKHNELQLINQELARAQVSLEQLRRCRVIPYPGAEGAPVSVDQVSDGTGAALEPSSGMHRPAHASPWGVTDGPYTRHYARWLIEDPEFEPAPLSRTSTVSGKSVEGRLRSVVGDGLTGRRRQRQSVDVGSPLSPSVAVPPPRLPGGPLLLTRADGVRVKLVCRHCSKEDINSVQGFLNHCRIAHSDSMKTHAEAAATHGVPLEEGELALATPTGEQAPSTPVVSTPTGPQHRVNIHPLNVAGRTFQPPLTPTATTPVRPSPLSTSFSASSGYFPAKAPTASKSRPVAKLESKVNDPNFVASPQTPSLSALAQKRGIGLDLAKLVTSAKQRIDLEKIETLVTESDSEERSRVQKALPMSRQPSGQPLAAAGASRMPAATAAAPESATSTTLQTVFQASSPQSEPATESLSPRSVAHTAGTSETNPGMMTDREDDPEDDDSVMADFEEDRTNVRIHDDHFPMSDIPMPDADAATDKIRSAQQTSITGASTTNPDNKHGRSRRRS